MNRRALGLGDVFWWVLAGVLGEGSFLLGLTLPLKNALLFGHIGLFMTGLVMGYLKPERAWRWGIGSVLLFPLVELIGLTQDHSFSSSLFDSLAYVFFKIPVYLFQSVCALVGAYVVAWIRAGQSFFGVWAGSVGLLTTGFLLGLLVGGIPLVMAHLLWSGRDPFDQPLSYVWWTSGFILAGGITSFFQPYWGWRVGFIVGLGFPAAAILMVIGEVALNLAKNNLWPFTVLFTLIVGVSSATLGAYLGTLLYKKTTKG